MPQTRWLPAEWDQMYGCSVKEESETLEQPTNQSINQSQWEGDSFMIWWVEAAWKMMGSEFAPCQQDDWHDASNSCCCDITHETYAERGPNPLILISHQCVWVSRGLVAPASLPSQAKANNKSLLLISKQTNTKRGWIYIIFFTFCLPREQACEWRRHFSGLDLITHVIS